VMAQVDGAIRKAVGQGFFLFGAEIEAHYYCQFVKVNLS
jgi:hypothetical protein